MAFLLRNSGAVLPMICGCARVLGTGPIEEGQTQRVESDHSMHTTGSPIKIGNPRIINSGGRMMRPIKILINLKLKK
jgi:hypothetical protein